MVGGICIIAESAQSSKYTDKLAHRSLLLNLTVRCEVTMESPVTEGEAVSRTEVTPSFSTATSPFHGSAGLLCEGDSQPFPGCETGNLCIRNSGIL